MFSTLPLILAVALMAAPNGAKNADAEAVWPAAAEKDFKLNVELVAPGSRDAKGVVQLANKTILRVRIKAEKNCEAAVYWIDTKGDVVQLFPNRFDLNGSLKAGEERTVPGVGKEYELETFPTAGEGNERLRVVAVTGAMPSAPVGEQKGPYTVYKTEASRKAIVSSVRGVVLKDKGNLLASGTIGTVGKPGAAGAVIQVAHTELLFRVKP